MRIENSFTEYGVRLGDSDRVVSDGKGYYGKLHAEQHLQRIIENAKLPHMGQPLSGTVVKREVVEIKETSDWEAI